MFSFGTVPPGKAHPSRGIVEEVCVVVIVPPPGSGHGVPLRRAETIHNYRHPTKTH